MTRSYVSKILTPKDLEREVNKELELIYRWLVSNKLTLNIKKSKFMIISKKKYEK